MASLPILARCLKHRPSSHDSNFMSKYRYGMLILTFFSYMSYHISRKPLSIVKTQLHRNCSNISRSTAKLFLLTNHIPVEQFDLSNSTDNNATWCDFPPFNTSEYKLLFGELDYAFLFTYAVGMFFSGMIAERLPIRYFISTGMLLSGISTAMFGIGYFESVHSFAFYVVAQVLNGLFQTTGWPAVVTVVGNWFGKQRRGLIMGIWNSHTSFGNIIGSVVASAFVASAWGLSFIVPGIIIGFFGIVCFFTLVEKPEDFGTRYQLLSTDELDIPLFVFPAISQSSSEYSDISGENGAAPNYNDLYPDYDSIENGNLKTDSCNNVTGKTNPANEQAIGFWGALNIPGVIEFSLCLLFAKLVSYTFLFWLPFYINNTSTLSTTNSGFLSTLFDVGGIFGGIVAGFASDKLNARASTCGVMLVIGAAMMYVFNTFGGVSLTVNIILLLVTGAFVNGPYALITTAVSADLGTHPILMGNAKALSTVTAIIDGTGSIGAAIGPLLTGFIAPYGWQNVFWMLIGSNLLALVFLTRLMIKEVKEIRNYLNSGRITFSSRRSSLPDPLINEVQNQANTR